MIEIILAIHHYFVWVDSLVKSHCACPASTFLVCALLEF